MAFCMGGDEAGGLVGIHPGLGNDVACSTVFVQAGTKWGVGTQVWVMTWPV